jgi:hypothetical protein
MLKLWIWQIICSIPSCCGKILAYCWFRLYFQFIGEFDGFYPSICCMSCRDGLEGEWVKQWFAVDTVLAFVFYPTLGFVLSMSVLCVEPLTDHGHTVTGHHVVNMISEGQLWLLIFIRIILFNTNSHKKAVLWPMACQQIKYVLK